MVSSFKIEFNKRDFATIINDLKEEMDPHIKLMRIKKKAVYFIQYLWEKYLVFWFSQLNETSTFDKC